MRLQLAWTASNARRDLTALGYFDEVRWRIYRADLSFEILAALAGKPPGNEQTSSFDLARLTNASAIDFVLRMELVEFRSAESGKVFRSRFRRTNPHWKHSMPVV